MLSVAPPLNRTCTATDNTSAQDTIPGQDFSSSRLAASITSAVPGGFGKRLITAASLAATIDLSRRRISHFIFASLPCVLSNRPISLVSPGLLETSSASQLASRSRLSSPSRRTPSTSASSGTAAGYPRPTRSNTTMPGGNALFATGIDASVDLNDPGNAELHTSGRVEASCSEIESGSTSEALVSVKVRPNKRSSCVSDPNSEECDGKGFDDDGFWSVSSRDDQIGN
nr:hypothetical protein Iba_chr02dCG5070 [Ipomoea batatas]